MTTVQDQEMRVTCPHCGNAFSVESAMRSQLSEKLRTEAEQEVLTKANQAHAEELLRVKKEQEKKALEEIAKAKSSNDEALAQEKERAARAEEEARQAKLKADAASKAQTDARKAMEEAAAKEAALAEREAQLGIEKSRWQAEQAKELAKRVRVEAEALAAQQREADKIEYDAKLKQGEERIATLENHIKKLSASTESKDGRSVGEGMELALESLLEARFPKDDIHPVPKGEPGADILQTVKQGERVAGTLCWESKKTAVFQSAYVEKIIRDMKDNGADLGIIVSTAFPAEHKDKVYFAPTDRVLVVRPAVAEIVADMLRRRVIDVSQQKDISMARPEAAQKVFEQVTSPVFMEALNALAVRIRELQEKSEVEYRALAQSYLDRQRIVFDLMGGLFEVAHMTVGLTNANLPPQLTTLQNMPRYQGTLPAPKKKRGAKKKRTEDLDGDLDGDDVEEEGGV